MSDYIYDNVIRSEFEGINRERLEMTVDIYEGVDCLTDQDFRTETNTQQPLQHTGCDSVKIRSSRAALVCLVLLCFLLLTAGIVLSVHINTNNRNCTQKASITNLTEDRHELLIKNAKLLREKDQLIKQLQIFGQEGWTYSQCSFYYLSNETKNWTESRRYCREREADLIIINNKVEQDFVMNITHEKEFWIGLTDSEEEGRWKWVDNTNVASGFWASSGSTTEPNGQREENCAVTHLKKHPELLGWLDVRCNGAHHWICEKSILLVPV